MKRIEITPNLASVAEEIYCWNGGLHLKIAATREGEREVHIPFHHLGEQVEVPRQDYALLKAWGYIPD